MLNPATADESRRTDRRLVSRIICDAASQGLKVLVIAGEGEPALDHDFKDVVKEASRAGLIPYIFTNGTELNTEMVTFLASHRASLIVSLDSLEPVRYTRLTGGGRLYQLLKNLDRCRHVYADVFDDNGDQKVVSLAINTVVTSINECEINVIRQFCGDDIVFVCNRPTRAGMAEQNWQQLYGENSSNPRIDSAVERMTQEHGPLGSTPDGKWCAYMKHGVSVGADGSILACAYSLGTQGCYRELSLSTLQESHREVVTSVEEFYRLHGHSRCILRHPYYMTFISRLRHCSEKVSKV